MLFDEIVATAETVTATRSRLAKVAAIADLLRRLDEDEIAPAVGFLVGSARQGRVGVGWKSAAAATGEPAAGATLTVADIDGLFDRLAALEGSGSGSSAARATALREIAVRAVAREQHFLTRMLLGEMRTGALAGVVTDAIARAADAPVASVRRAAMLSGDLGATALVALRDGADALDDVELVVGRPVMPMLAASAPTVAEAITATGESSVEFKLDGARIQVHRSGDDVRVFTRTLAEVTHRLPEIVDAVRRMPVHDVILDGETLALDEAGAPRPFQETMSRFGADRAREVALRPWFFDVLHLDGRDLLDEPLSTRLAELERIAPGSRVEGAVTSDPDVAERVSRDALAAGHEGVVVKAIDSVYAAGRRGSSWIKVKPVHTYDLVVLAVERGSGRRSGWLSNIHVGARDPDGEFGPAGGFVMVGKTFKGLTDELLRWQTEHFERIATRRDVYVVEVAPTTVVEIAIDGVQRSSRYPGGVALRFARVKRYRDDKPADEADPIGALRALLRIG